MKTVVINLFGGPGCGKSTIAAELFAILKKQGYEVELVTEYAKDKVWEESLKSVIPAKMYDINEKAFKKGLDV